MYILQSLLQACYNICNIACTDPLIVGNGLSGGHFPIIVWNGLSGGHFPIVVWNGLPGGHFPIIVGNGLSGGHFLIIVGNGLSGGLFPIIVGNGLSGGHFSFLWFWCWGWGRRGQKINQGGCSHLRTGGTAGEKTGWAKKWKTTISARNVECSSCSLGRPRERSWRWRSVKLWTLSYSVFKHYLKPELSAQFRF